MEADERESISVEAAQGTAVLLLASRGHEEAAELLEVATLRSEWARSDWGREFSNIFMGVDLNLYDSYNNETVSLIRDALNDAHLATKEGVALVYVHPNPVEGDWRQMRRDARSTGITNQAVRRPLAPDHPVQDGLHFRSDEELRVYDALVRWQVAAPSTDTISIAPNPGLKILGRVIEPDLLVTYRGRVAGVEVDGPHHYGRAAADHSRDSMLRDGGLAFVERIAVEDTTNDAELDEFVRKLVRRMER